ncbi:hypothetical protein RJ639_035212 [Escallonia herrerae]|uniref:Retrotransposon gag domain-containing protein n=1 Tax=Escallonia herrerae TaxID=1293975 RepID=A0AA88WQC0_9ASTE|nr:hypothetical protein RJ639_035212 [Escallonia herrerae]
MTWDQFKDLFFDRYFPRSVKEQMYRDFLNLRQGENESVAEYEVKFTQLSHYGKQLVANEKDRVQMFTWGLKPSIRQRIVPVPIETYVQCVDIAKTIEAEAKDYREKERCQDKQERLPRTISVTHGTSKLDPQYRETNGSVFHPMAGTRDVRSLEKVGIPMFDRNPETFDQVVGVLKTPAQLDLKSVSIKYDGFTKKRLFCCQSLWVIKVGDAIMSSHVELEAGLQDIDWL